MLWYCRLETVLQWSPANKAGPDDGCERAVVCSDCNQYVAGMIRQHKFLSGVVDKLASDDGKDEVSRPSLSLAYAVILLIPGVWHAFVTHRSVYDRIMPQTKMWLVKIMALDVKTGKGKCIYIVLIFVVHARRSGTDHSFTCSYTIACRYLVSVHHTAPP